MSEPTVLSRHYGKWFLAAAVLAVICITAFVLSANQPRFRVGPGAGSTSGSDIIAQLTAFLTVVTAFAGAIGKFQDNKVNEPTKPDNGLPPVYYRPERKEFVIGDDGPWIDIDLLEWDGRGWVRIDRYRKLRTQPPPTRL